jgi:predicted metal-dependent enzyme (double-stranded beta helix superfamily)
MAEDTYTLDDFLSDLRKVLAETTSEPEILSRVASLARRVALARSWMTARLYEADPEQGFGSHLLHQGADHTPFVTVVSWLPGRGAPPHDHGTWAVVVGVEGVERNSFWERVDDHSKPGHAELRQTGGKDCGPGDVLAMPSGTIHGVKNESGSITLSFHVYGRPLNATGRSKFDPASGTESPFVVRFQQ